MLNDESHIEAQRHHPECPASRARSESIRPLIFGNTNSKTPARMAKTIRADGDEMKMSDEVVAVLRLPIERDDGMADPGESAAEKLHEKRDGRRAWPS